MESAEQVGHAVGTLLDEFQSFPPEVVSRTRQAALAAVARWRWTDIGAPGIGDFHADLWGGERFPWHEARPNADDPAHCGLDADGRVRVIRHASVSTEQVVEHSPERVRSLMLDAQGTLGGIEDVFVDGGRYRFAVAVTREMWSYSRHEYDDRRLRSVWHVRHLAGEPRPVAVLMTLKYDRRGRFKDVVPTIEGSAPLPEMPPAPSASSITGVADRP
ncbi:MAG TPA: hypothetical protein VFG79_06255 [Solirubrobacter sp.]|nr:hypothetical protein [Solirubrobacter sp.]